MYQKIKWRVSRRQNNKATQKKIKDTSNGWIQIRMEVSNLFSSPDYPWHYKAYGLCPVQEAGLCNWVTSTCTDIHDWVELLELLIKLLCFEDGNKTFVFYFQITNCIHFKHPSTTLRGKHIPKVWRLRKHNDLLVIKISETKNAEKAMRLHLFPCILAISKT